VPNLKDLAHPMQPIGWDENGSVRFKRNAILRWLVDTRKVNLNAIDFGSFPVEDIGQFFQLLGYSTSAYGSLSFVPEALRDEADRKASDVLDEKKAKR
jgi:hypothetical protein